MDQITEQFVSVGVVAHVLDQRSPISVSVRLLLKLLANTGYAQTTPELRANLLDFYKDLESPIETKRHKDDWNEVLRDLDALKKVPEPAAQGAP